MDRISDVREPEGNYVERHNFHRICQQAGRPAQPNATSIVAAIDRLITDSRAGGGPEIEFYDDLPIEELPSELQMVMFLIVKELLANACRHSESNNVLVGLGQDDGRVCIQVQDWGVGFDPEMVQLYRHGLKVVQQFVQWRGGTMSIDSRSGGGTCVTIEIPLSLGNGPRDPNCERG
jgi:signal transduction histidine kinase